MDVNIEVPQNDKPTLSLDTPFFTSSQGSLMMATFCKRSGALLFVTRMTSKGPERSLFGPPYWHQQIAKGSAKLLQKGTTFTITV